jgi:hypothetical protein
VNDIIILKGKVSYPITLDPSVWIFDDRKVERQTLKSQNDESDSKELTARQWSREISEGNVSPPTLKSERKYERERILTGSFAIHLSHFLKNAEPLSEACELAVITQKGEVIVPLTEAYSYLLAFSKDGKPLKDDGPVHLLKSDGTTEATHVTGFQVR